MSSNDKLKITCIGKLEGHNGRVTSLAVSTDANGNPLLISGGQDRKLIVWDLDLEREANENAVLEAADQANVIVGRPKKSLQGHKHFISKVEFHEKGQHVISSSWDRTMRLWDLKTYKSVLFQGHSKDVLTATFLDTRTVVSGSMDNTLQVWNTQGEAKYTCTEFEGWVSCICPVPQSNKDKLLAVGSWDGNVRLFDKEYNLQQTYANNYPVVRVCTDADADFLLVGERKGDINFFALKDDDNTVKKTLSTNATYLNDFVYDSKHLNVITCATSEGLVIKNIEKESESFYVDEI